MKQIQTDINGDILILYLKINELKASNVILNSQNFVTNINNLNEQMNNDLYKILLFIIIMDLTYKKNYLLRYKIFPDNKDSNSEIV